MSETDIVGTRAVPSMKMPSSSQDITPDLINAIIHPWHPEIMIDTVDIAESKEYGDGMVSTAARAVIDVTYSSANSKNLPSRLVFKLARSPDFKIGPLYANEVRFYNLLRPEFLDVEAPLCLGGAYDPATEQFGLLLEDLTLRGARFPNTTVHVSLAEVESVLEQLARVHAQYWLSPRFNTDLSWVETHVAGPLAEFMQNHVPPVIQQEIDTENFKRELVERLRTTGEELRRGTRKLHEHQQTLPYTLLHGDTHLGNTYLLPEGRGGLLDWQLSVRGHHMHDVNYLITTALSIGTRRKHERDLLTFYLDRLKAFGVSEPPSFEDSWTEYRRTLVWGVYIGWLTTNVANYGWEINILNHLRLTTAFEDHETSKLVAELG
jgi:thiamine kinase-like enzyme